MTEEDFKYFSKYEKNFRTAIDQDYSSAIPVRDLILMKEKSGWSGTLNLSCSRCTMKLLKYFGAQYFEYKNIEEDKTA